MGTDTNDNPTTQETLENLPSEGDDPQVVLQEQDDEDLPPLRMHATRVPQRLSGSSNPLIVPDGLKKQGRRGSFRDSSNPRSRSRSPSVKNTETTFDAGSSISSLQDLEDLDPDILLDKAGFEELDPVQTQANVKDLQASVSSLPAVNERLCNDDLEDVHAFSDVNIQKVAQHSRDNSIATGEAILETLDEVDDENDNNHNIDDDNSGRPEVILENMENLELDDREESAGGSQSVPTS